MRKSMNIVFYLLGYLLLTAGAVGQECGEEERDPRFWITVEREGEMLLLAASGTSSIARDSLRYSFVVERDGRNGVSRSAQSGNFHIHAGEQTVLSRTSVNLHERDSCIVLLRIFAGEHCIEEIRQSNTLSDVSHEAKHR